MKPVWSSLARRDLRELLLYIAEDSPQNAAIVNTRILNAAELLGEFPNAGRPGRVHGTRERIVSRTPYILVYKMDEELVRILRVLRGARKWPNNF